MARHIVLVVEDDPAIRRGLVDTLAAGGYEVRESDNGEDARTMALGGGIDLALLDGDFAYRHAAPPISPIRPTVDERPTHLSAEVARGAIIGRSSIIRLVGARPSIQRDR